MLRCPRHAGAARAALGFEHACLPCSGAVCLISSPRSLRLAARSHSPNYELIPTALLYDPIQQATRPIHTAQVGLDQCLNMESKNRWSTVAGAASPAHCQRAFGAGAGTHLRRCSPSKAHMVEPLLPLVARRASQPWGVQSTLTFRNMRRTKAREPR